MAAVVQPNVQQQRPSNPSSHHSRHGSHGRVQETPEQRKERKERERRKAHEEAKRKGKEPHKGEVKKDKSSKSHSEENRLQRSTNFLCRIQFRTDLPQVPIEPKLISIPTSWDRFCQYETKTFDEGQQHDLPLDPDLGIPLDILEAPQYLCPQSRVLDPRDEALLQSSSQSSGISSGRARKIVNADNLGWLMRTQYINPDEQSAKKSGLHEKAYKEMKQRTKEQEEPQTYVDENAAEIALIEESFEAARRAPKHSTNPKLTAVEVLPVLPDEDRWPMNMVQIQFDMNPVEQVDRLTDVNEETRQRVADHAVIKSFSVMQEEGGGLVKFASYMIPSAEGMQEIQAGMLIPEEGTAVGTSDAVEYEWVREYHYEAKAEDTLQGTMLMFYEDGKVKYAPVETKLLMQKHKARGKADKSHRKGEGGMGLNIERPKSVSLKRRLPTEDEEEATNKKLRHLQNPVEAEAAEAQQHQYSAQEYREEEEDDE